MSTYSQYFHPQYIDMMRKMAAQPPVDAGMPPGGMPMPPDAAMMGGMPPGAMPPDAAMMGGAMPPGAMPPPGMDPAMMGGMPPMPPAGDPMAAAMPPAAPADPAAGGAPKSGKQQKEEFMNNIQTCLDDIKDYTYNNLMILIRIANALNIQIPAETLVSPPDGKNMDIMTDPAAISAAAGGAPVNGMPPMAPPAGGDMGGSMGGPAPEDLPPADQAPSEVKMSMYNRLGIPSPSSKSAIIKRAMHYLMNQNKTNVSNQMAQWLNGK